MVCMEFYFYRLSLTLYLPSIIFQSSKKHCLFFVNWLTQRLTYENLPTSRAYAHHVANAQIKFYCSIRMDWGVNLVRS